MSPSQPEAKAVMMRCRACHDSGTEWGGCEVFANDTGCYIHCRNCQAFIARTDPVPVKLECDLCKEGDTDHDHGEEEFGDAADRQKPEDTETHNPPP